MRAFVLLALVACAHASSSYASGSSTTTAASPSATASSATAASSAFGSGSTSAAASASASKAPTPAKSPTPTPAKAPTPTPAKAAEHRVVSAVTLTGVTVDMFNATSAAGKATRKAFQGTVADSMGVKAEDVVITGVKATRRAGVAIDFYVKVKDAKAAEAGAKSLNTALTATGTGKSFASKLVAKAKSIDATLALAKVDPAKITTTVTKKPEAKVIKPAPTPTTVGSAPATAVVSMASVAFAALALC